VCASERERENERDRETERQRKRESTGTVAVGEKLFLEQVCGRERVWRESERECVCESQIERECVCTCA